MSVRVLASVLTFSEAEHADRLTIIAIADHASDDGVAWPSEETIGRKARLGVSTVRRSIGKLVSMGELEVRKAQRGQQRLNVYRILCGKPVPVEYDRLPFELEPGFTTAQIERRSNATSTTAQIASRVKNEPSKEPSSSSGRGWPPKTLDDKKLTDDEILHAGEILDAFNDVFEKKFKSPEFLRLIVLRLREHPDMTVGDFRAVIEKASRHRWWERTERGRGDFTPKVIFGNSVIFDRTMNRDEKAGDDDADEFAIYNK